MIELLQQFRWHPEIGDSSLLGWATTAAYALAAITACAAARRAGRAPGLVVGSRAIWFSVSALMTFLCLNKQLDLQSLLTDIGRIISWKQGWYEHRREFQKWFVIAVLAASSLGALCAIIWCRGFWRSHFLLISGLLLLLAFIVLRAVSIHHLDALFGPNLEDSQALGLMELTSIVLIWLAALRDYRNAREAPRPLGKTAD